jgi:cytoskeletal protein CcmA (bactofilin family)
MALPDLTGQNIQDTYQRVLQVSSSGDITDGTGSLFTPPNAVSASYALSASHEIIKEISSSHADTASYIEASNIDQPFTDIVITNPSGTLIPGDGSTSSIAVTVVNDGQNRFVLDGVKTGSVTLVAGNSYKFDTSDSSNLTHPFAFQVSGSGASYTTGVTVNGSGYSSPAPGEAGAYVQISVTNATPRLIYYCTSHGTGMGGETVLPITTGSLVQNGSLTITGSLDLQSGSANIEGDITASGNISSSGTIHANIGLFAGNIEVDGDIHADNNIVGDGATNIYNISSISASGNISGSDLLVRDGRFSRDGFAAEVEIIASETAGGIVGTNTSDNLILRRFNVPKFTLSESRNFSHQDLDVQGNISSSGTASMGILNVGGGEFTSASLAAAVAGEGETYDLNASADGDNVDLNLTSTSGTDNSVVQFTAGPNITLNRVSGAEVVISASGGSSFPFSGSAVITGSLTVTGSITGTPGTINNLTSSLAMTASHVDIGSLPLVNPIVEYFSCTALTASGTTVTLPNSLTFVSSSTYEYIEVFFNGLRLRYDVDFIPQSTSTIQFQIALPSGSELTYKSLKRP